MAKKQITVLLVLTIVACSSVSIYAAESREVESSNDTEKGGQRVEQMVDEYDEAEAQKEAEKRRKLRKRKRRKKSTVTVLPLTSEKLIQM